MKLVEKLKNKIRSVMINRFCMPILEERYSKSGVDKNKIVVDNFYGQGYGDNPKYVISSLVRKAPNLDIVWLVNSLSYKFPDGVRPVLIDSLQAKKELLTAAVWIDNIKNFRKPPKKNNQFYLQTWHAGLGLKASEAQIKDQLNNDYIKADKEDSQKIDLMLSDSSWTTNIYSKYFWYEGEIRETGFPKNDILVNSPKDRKNKVYKTFTIPSNFKIILYAPTFRDSGDNIDVYKHNFKAIQKVAQKKFKDKYVVLVRLHPNMIQKIGTEICFDFDNKQMFNASNYPDMQELIIASDILITDYSSCMFDAMMAGKKVFLLACDYEHFISTDRKLLFSINELPFTLSTSDEQLLIKIEQYREIDYINQVNKFKKIVSLKEPGNASDKVADIILKQMSIN